MQIHALDENTLHYLPRMLFIMFPSKIYVVFTSNSHSELSEIFLNPLIIVICFFGFDLMDAFQSLLLELEGFGCTR